MKFDWRHLVVVFLAGLIIGWAAAARLHWRRGPRDWDNPHHFQRMLGRLNDRLHLTPDQQKQIAGIFQNSRAKIESLHKDVRPKFDEIRQHTNEQIRKILNPEQQVAFDRMRVEWDAKRQQRMKEWKGQ